MKIDWKDFGVGLIIAIILLITIAVLVKNNGPQLLTPFLGLMSFGIPLAFYFWRNKCDLATASAISFIFGITFDAVCLLALIQISSIPIFGLEITATSITMIAFLFQLLLVGIFSTIPGLIIYFAINKLLKR